MATPKTSGTIPSTKETSCELAAARTNEEVKHAVLNCYSTFVSDVDPDTLSDELIQQRIITIRDWERIKGKEVTSHDRCRSLLNHLYIQHNPRTFLVVRQALERNAHWILEKIDQQTSGYATEGGQNKTETNLKKDKSEQLIVELLRRIDQLLEENCRLKKDLEESHFHGGKRKDNPIWKPSNGHSAPSTPQCPSDLDESGEQPTSLRTGSEHIYENGNHREPVHERNKLIEETLQETVNSAHRDKELWRELRLDKKVQFHGTHDQPTRTAINGGVGSKQLRHASKPNRTGHHHENSPSNLWLKTIKPKDPAKPSKLSIPPKTENFDYAKTPELFRTGITDRSITGSNKKSIYGLTVLDRELFITRESSSVIEAYDTGNFTLNRSWELNELVDPVDCQSCVKNKCLYIIDWKSSGQKREIFRVEPDGKLHCRWSVGDDTGRLSVTEESNVILAVYWKHKLKEYSSDGELIREINLSPDIRIINLWHAIKLPNGHYVVSHGHANNSLHRVCQVNENGDLIRSTNEEIGSVLVSFDEPIYLAADGNGSILVADRNNSKVVLLSSTLDHRRDLISKENGLESPRRIFLDEATGQLFVSHKQKGEVVVFKLS